MTTIGLSYLPLIFLFGISLALVLVLFFVSFLLGSSSFTDFEKLTTYECGFEPFSDTQGTFDIKFFLVAMLFMLFDLEVMFLLPWSLSIDEVSFTSFLLFIWFFIVLTIAFVYEWLTGALDWQ